LAQVNVCPGGSIPGALPAMGAAVADAYAVLGVQLGSDRAAVRRAYRSLALRCHPDKCAPARRAEAEARFKEIGAAYELLSAAGAAAPPPPRSRPRAPPAAPRGLPERRIWFARGSASVGRAYRGLEGEELARERQEAFDRVAQWLGASDDVVLEVRGYCLNSEVPLKSRDALAKARGEKAVQYFVTKCSLASDAFRTLPGTAGVEFQGVEFVAFTRIDVDGTFQPDALGVDGEVLDDVAQACRGAAAVLEIHHGGNVQLARARLAAVRRSLQDRGVTAVRGRVVRGEVEVARFYVQAAPG